MKKIFFTGLLAGSFALINSTGYAQDTTSAGEDIENAAKKTGNAIEKGAKKVGNKTAEIASKGKAGMVDQVYKGKEGPDGQTIYIDNESKYYWIDKKGHRNFIEEAELKDKS